ncbi:sugar transferase [Thalassococcus lentus]|uniref:Sugar transferase n=1 Tax=Thalassococcus lentus TaxID=1210524 RepID=A0ABT4XN38_9RHOB|nr:sugar transferase [Thalassococcus lentus]MDA7423345.1 sugar transferase [Thalassococcus lentus]
MSPAGQKAFRIFILLVLLIELPVMIALVPIVVLAGVLLPRDLFFRLCAGGLFILLLPPIIVVSVLVLVRDGRPILYRAERMKAPGKPFNLLKFRTMSVAETDSGVSGGDKVSRITPLGAFLRDKRLDELPQLINIMRGDITFVGPRPPLRRYVEMYPDLYADVLKAKPGITGLASLIFHRTEERLLAPCNTAEETEDVYCRRCIPRKARLDLIYANRQTVCSDFRVMVATVVKRVKMH